MPNEILLVYFQKQFDLKRIIVHKIAVRGMLFKNAPRNNVCPPPKPS